MGSPKSEDQQLIEQVKAHGIKGALFDEARVQLHTARVACEEGAKDAFKNFRREIEAAKAAIHKAEVCYAEWYNL